MERARPAAQATATKNRIALSTIQIENHRNENCTYLSDDSRYAFFRCLGIGCCRVKATIVGRHIEMRVCMWRGIVCLHFIQILTQIQNPKKTKAELKSINTEYRADREKNEMVRWLVGRSVYDVNENAVMMVFHHGG